ncbi:uncharacterized protein LOC134839816 [Symsagittifera roscoffensis]|uniref:uncharacterized protein LOC134839816 n=1 Tax=Symsagittifera roscoffensis TaxID=84072 RepID=UPI00307BE605
MKGKVLIGLSKDNDEPPVFLPFNINSEKLPEEIAECFKRNRPPEFLYDVTGNRESRNVKVLLENTELTEGRHYLWVVEDEAHWQDKTLVQNALFCSIAAYQINPLDYLNDTRNYHGVKLLIAANVKFGKQIASLFIASTDLPSENEKMLIVAFRGTSTKEDIKSDLQFGLETDETFEGEVHGGFLERMKSVPVEEILSLALRLQVKFVVTCGHSLGGAVSSLVNIKLKKELEVRNWTRRFSNNLINITFGAPMIGNYAFAQYLKKNYSKKMYNFVSDRDVVPASLFIGYGLQCMKEKSRGFSKYALKTAVNYSTSCYQLLLKSLNFDVDPEKIKNAVKALKEVHHEPNYVPIGNYLLFHETSGRIEHLSNDQKTLVKQILQKTIDFACDNPSEITNCHSIESYFDSITRSYDGFVTFKNRERKILIEKNHSKDFFGEDGLSYRFDSVSSFNCGHEMCADPKPVYVKKQPVSICHTCKVDPTATEHFYHGSVCRPIVHKLNEHRQILKELDWSRFKDRPKEFELIFADPKKVYLMKLLLQIFRKLILSLGGVLLLIIFVMAVVSLLDCFWIISGHVYLIFVFEFLFSKDWIEKGFKDVILRPCIGFFVLAGTYCLLMCLKISISRATEDELKASVIVDALRLLEVPLPNTKFEDIRKDDVMKCFRKKALLFHPDRQIELSENAAPEEKKSQKINETEKKENEEAIDAIDFSRNILVSYCRNPTILSNSVVEIVQKNLEYFLFDPPIPLSIQLGKGIYPPEKTEIKPINVKIKTLKKRKAKSTQSYTTEKKT